MFRQYNRDLYRFALRLLGSPDQADEVVQGGVHRAEAAEQARPLAVFRGARYRPAVIATAVIPLN